MARHGDGSAGIFFAVPEMHVGSHFRKREAPRASEKGDLVGKPADSKPRGFGVAPAPERPKDGIFQQRAICSRKALGKALDEALRIPCRIAKRPEERAK